jgi:hypothetical protein
MEHPECQWCAIQATQIPKSDLGIAWESTRKPTTGTSSISDNGWDRTISVVFFRLLTIFSHAVPRSRNKYISLYLTNPQRILPSCHARIIRNVLRLLSTSRPFNAMKAHPLSVRSHIRIERSPDAVTSWFMCFRPSDIVKRVLSFISDTFSYQSEDRHKIGVLCTFYQIRRASRITRETRCSLPLPTSPKFVAEARASRVG